MGIPIACHSKKNNNLKKTSKDHSLPSASLKTTYINTPKTLCLRKEFGHTTGGTQLLNLHKSTPEVLEAIAPMADDILSGHGCPFLIFWNISWSQEVQTKINT